MSEYKIDYCHHDSVTMESRQEYIKREGAIDAVDKCRHDTFQQLNGMKGYLNAIPSADVVPVVRCKDCIHFINHDKRCGYFNHGIKTDDYCSYGERKDNECK